MKWKSNNHQLLEINLTEYPSSKNRHYFPRLFGLYLEYMRTNTQNAKSKTADWVVTVRDSERDTITFRIPYIFHQHSNSLLFKHHLRELFIRWIWMKGIFLIYFFLLFWVFIEISYCVVLCCLWDTSDGMRFIHWRISSSNFHIFN